jgi:exopolysaccharide biosynthesis WecB/TagA/CpsF family protein
MSGTHDVLATNGAKRMDSQRRIGQVTFLVTDQPGAVRQVHDAITARTCAIFAFCNMHTFNLACRFPDFAAALAQATIFNDGVGVDLGSMLLFGTRFPHNLNGTDLTPLILASLQTPTSVFLLGGRPGVAAKAAIALQEDLPNVVVVGSHHGFFGPEDAGPIADRIRNTGAELVLVGMGNPHQELWAASMARRTGAVVICVGAYLDFVSGAISRAPRLLRRIRCEWLYRMAREPARLSTRYVGGALPFLFAIISERIAPPALLHADPTADKDGKHFSDAVRGDTRLPDHPDFDMATP